MFSYIDIIHFTFIYDFLKTESKLRSEKWTIRPLYMYIKILFYIIIIKNIYTNDLHNWFCNCFMYHLFITTIKIKPYPTPEFFFSNPLVFIIIGKSRNASEDNILMGWILVNFPRRPGRVIKPHPLLFPKWFSGA